ncbi:AMP-binding protein [Streptomyces sp. NPDC050636]|uniref:AMP-binding protein n=1 Tax=Streptomyces sp. NPDC050636 TaxID=3154510 RepID=UPI00341B9878
MAWTTLPERVAEHAELRPDAPALLWHGREVGYAALRGMSEAARKNLESLGLPASRPVALVAKKSPEAVAVLLACMGIRQPVLIPSAELGEDSLRALLAHAGAQRLPDPGELVSSGPVPCLEPSVPRNGPRVPQDTALLLTTSGSTGLPKAVPIPAAALDRFTEWAGERFGIGPGTTVLNYAPLNFDLCLLDIWTTLARGGCATLVDQDLAVNPAHLLTLFQARPVQVVQGVPMLFQLLAQAAGHAHDGEFERVEHILLTGDAISEKGLAALPALFPKAALHNVYGCTETNDSFAHEIDAAADRQRYGSLPIGRPIPGVEALVLDEDGSVLTGPGRGELLVRTPFQAVGYLDAALDDGVFVPHPDGTSQERCYRTGDLVRRHPDGTLTLEGRRDFVVKVRGVRINTAEVEEALRGHQEVVDAAVLALPDERAGKRLHAVVQRTEGSALNGLRLREHVAKVLPRVGIPATFELLDTPLPRTSTGKLDRKAALRHLRGQAA